MDAMNIKFKFGQVWVYRVIQSKSVRFLPNMRRGERTGCYVIINMEIVNYSVHTYWKRQVKAKIPHERSEALQRVTSDG